MDKEKVTLKNRLNQPLVINLTAEEAVRFKAKEMKTIEGKHLEALEVKRLIELGDLALIRIR